MTFKVGDIVRTKKGHKDWLNGTLGKVESIEGNSLFVRERKDRGILRTRPLWHYEKNELELAYRKEDAQIKLYDELFSSYTTSTSLEGTSLTEKTMEKAWKKIKEKGGEIENMDQFGMDTPFTMRSLNSLSRDALDEDYQALVKDKVITPALKVANFSVVLEFIIRKNKKALAQEARDRIAEREKAE